MQRASSTIYTGRHNSSYLRKVSARKGCTQGDQTMLMTSCRRLYSCPPPLRHRRLNQLSSLQPTPMLSTSASSVLPDLSSRHRRSLMPPTLEPLSLSSFTSRSLKDSFRHCNRSLVYSLSQAALSMSFAWTVEAPWSSIAL